MEKDTRPIPHPPLGIIGGSAFLEEPEFMDARLIGVETARGTVSVREGPGFVFLRRHGEQGYRPPHRIPHHAHVLAFEALGIEDVVGLASTGSLDSTIAPGSIVVPDDYFSRHPPPTFAEDEYLHIVPALDPGLRSFLLDTAAGPHIRDGGVYAETTGPRFETRAEVRALARDASLVGMTAASEATLFQEKGIRYAMLCVVDNWANGVGEEPLTLEAFQAMQAANGRTIRHILRELVTAWRVRRGLHSAGSPTGLGPTPTVPPHPSDSA